MNRKIIDYLQNVEISHAFAKIYNHGIQSIKTNGKWDLFEPTSLVFVFL